MLQLITLCIIIIIYLCLKLKSVHKILKFKILKRCRKINKYMRKINSIYMLLMIFLCENIHRLKEHNTRPITFTIGKTKVVVIVIHLEKPRVSRNSSRVKYSLIDEFLYVV
jgi:hypothetical protein